MISIVIPAYNEEKLIGKCLNSLLGQRTKQAFEVIVVDNNSTDTTRKIVDTYKNKLDLHICSEKIKGRGAARKLGFSHAKGTLILSTDADTILPENWIEVLTSPFTDPSIAAVTGTCSIRDCTFMTNFLFNTIYQTSTELIYRILERHWCLIGPNFAVRKELYDLTNGFDTSLNCREDADISAKIAKVGKIKRITLAVTFSGRRYTHGIVRGSLPYVKNRLNEFFMGKQKIILNDIR